MSRWPVVDRVHRAKLLSELRVRDTRRAAAHTPAERIERMFDLMALAELVHAGGRTQSDESAEDWLRIKARLRDADER